MRKRLVRFILALVAAAFLTIPNRSYALANPCAGQNPCAANPCAPKGKTAKGKKQVKNPCAANPCDAKKK